MAISTKLFWGRLGLATLAVGGVLSVALLKTGLTIQKLLTENKQLKEAIANLTAEEQIGFAKVTGQERINGNLYTTLKFVETAPDDPLKELPEAWRPAPGPDPALGSGSSNDEPMHRSTSR